jgi:hypothetical protein
MMRHLTHLEILLGKRPQDLEAQRTLERLAERGVSADDPRIAGMLDAQIARLLALPLPPESPPPLPPLEERDE